MIAATACVIIGAMLVRAPRDDDFAALAAITNHYIATTTVHFAYAAIEFWQKRFATGEAGPPGA